MPPDPPKTVTLLISLQTTQQENLRSKMANFDALPLNKFWVHSSHENITFK